MPRLALKNTHLIVLALLWMFASACSDTTGSSTDTGNTNIDTVQPSDGAGTDGVNPPNDGSEADSAGQDALSDTSSDGSGPEDDASSDASNDDVSELDTFEPDVPKEPAGYPSDGLFIRITSPDGGVTAQVMGSVTTIGGLLFGDADTVTWQTSNGQSGPVKEAAFWQSGPIDLTPGDNVITVTASKDDVVTSDTITLTYNPTFRFDETLRARPRVAWVGTGTNIVFTASVGLYANFDASKVKLLRVDENGITIKDEGSMKDNGNTGTYGDEIQGDGVFSFKVKNFNCVAAGPVFFRASVPVTQGDNQFDALTPMIPITCAEHLKVADCQGHQSIVSQAEGQYTGGMSQAEVISALKQNPQVTDAGSAAGNGNGIWIRFQSGVLGAVMLNPAGQRGSGSNGADSGSAQLGIGANIVEIGSRSAMVLAPFYQEFGVTDDGPNVAASLANTECPSFDLEGQMALQGAAASLDKFRNMPNYGVVSISTHGDALFGELADNVKKEFYRWNHTGAHEVIWSGEAVNCGALMQNKKNCTITDGNPTGGCPAGTTCVVTEQGGDYGSGECIDRTQVDLRTGRVVITNKGYAMTPAFLQEYGQTQGGRGYPKSLVNVGACRSMYNGSIAATLFANGASAITGFSGYVDSQWAGEKVTEMFEGSVGQGQIGVSHSGGEDPSNPGSNWRILGAGNLDLSQAEIINASFESGEVTGWRRIGDGRVITQLGVVGPPQGKFMGVISTGLGFTVKLGLLEQDFCIPEDKNTIEVYWRFFSEEFLEYCGSPYQDTFQAVLKSNGQQITVVDLKIDDLCGYGDGSCNSCQNPSPCHPDCMGKAGCELEEATMTCTGNYPCQCGKYFYGLVPATVGFDQGGVYKTATWLKTTKNIKAFAGQGKVTLTLSSGDTGDSIFDTVILIDAIKFN
jgi:hypothetical protein